MRVAGGFWMCSAVWLLCRMADFIGSFADFSRDLVDPKRKAYHEAATASDNSNRIVGPARHKVASGMIEEIARPQGCR